MRPETHRLAARLAVTAIAIWVAAAVVYGAFALEYGDRPAYVHVRWAPSVDDTARAALEQRYHLTRGQLREGRTWGYFIADVSRANLRAVVQDPRIEDTHQINRQRYTIWRTADRDPYRGRFAPWLPVTLQLLAVLLLLAGALAAALAALEAVGAPASLRQPLRPLALAFSTPPPVPGRHVAARAGRWLGDRVPEATAESVAVFRIVFGLALVTFFVLKPVGAEWVTNASGGNPLTPLQEIVLQRVFANPAVADWLRVWIVCWGALFIAGALARTSFVMLTLGALAWGCVYTTHIGTHSISALMVTLICLVWSRWGDAWSVDAHVRRPGHAAGLKTRPTYSSEYGYTIWIPGLVLGVALAAAAVSKVREHGLAWILNGTVKYHFLTDSREALVDWGLWLGPHATLAVLVSFAAVAIEALVVVGVFSRTYAWRALAGAAAFSLLVGFALFQGLFWPAWWILLLSFLPWHRVGAPASAPAVAATPSRWSLLRIAQVATIVAVALQQVVVTRVKAEVNPLLSSYDMYSTTYASPEEYENKAGMTYWLVARADDGTTRSCAVARKDAELLATVTAATAGREKTKGLVDRCFGPSAPTHGLSVEGRSTAIDWKRWRLGGEKHVPLGGPVQVEVTR